MAKKNTNVNLFKLRVILDTDEDVFRDIEIECDSKFEALHSAVLDAFDFEEGEMSSFYMSNDEWEKGLEISLMDMGEEGSMSMANTTLSEMISKPGDKVLYVYDFLRMWIFYIEVMEVKKDKPSTIYPRVALVYGDAPSQDSKEIVDMFGEEGLDEDEGLFDDEDEDEFGSEDEMFDEDEFGGSYRYDED